MDDQRPMGDRDPLTTFFVRYGDALASGNLPGISSCYDVPALVVHDRGAMAIDSRRQVEDAFDGAAEVHRAAGLVAARPTVLTVEPLTDVPAIANVHWDYCDAEGRSREQDGYRYLLRYTAGGPLIQVVVETPPARSASAPQVIDDPSPS